MFPGYKNITNAFGLKALLKIPIMPNPNLAIADDDEMSNIPLLIFTKQNPRIAPPVMPNIMDLPYEKTAVKGANDTLDMTDFVTDDFQLGDVYDFII